MALQRYFGTLVNVSLPDLGEGTKEATIKEILVKVGQRVEEVSLDRNNLKKFLMILLQYNALSYKNTNLTLV